MLLQHQLEQYQPFNEQEAKDLELIQILLLQEKDIFERSCRFAHITASAWVVNPNRDKVLMAYHKIYDSWAWLGGHADGERNLLETALREVREESGVTHVKPLSEDIFSVEVLTVDGHEKNGSYVSSHLHLNITYLLEADESDALHKKEDENCAVAWFGLEEAVEASTEEWFKKRIYRKLNEKLKQIL